MPDTDHILLMTAPAEIAFVPALFEKRQPAGKGAARWELALLMDNNHPDLQHAKQICKAVAERQQPGITTSPAAWKYPWSKADDYIAKGIAAGKTHDNSHMAGKVLLNTHATTYEPKLSVLMPGRGVVDFWDDAARQTVKDKFYMGCQVLCEIAFVWYPPGNGLPGVTAYLNKVCSLNRGERRGGGKSGAETFGAHVGHLSAVDPTAMAGAEVDY
jgi:Protein of unknown function (DUF2815)